MYFNPRSREGSDFTSLKFCIQNILISIHAPAKGATSKGQRRFHKLNFNPRSREGSDVGFRVDEWLTVNFNPRSREGSDARGQVTERQAQEDFNPRSREGSDLTAQEFDTVMAISIHAPAKGATTSITQPCPRIKYFNPRSREGSDRQRILQSLRISHFNPRSREGSDAGGFYTGVPVPDFNPRSREGSDRSRWRQQSRINNFNPRSREGSDATWLDSYVREVLFQSTLPRRERLQ